LKALQETLGEFQDSAVQVEMLQQIAGNVEKNRFPPETLRAMETLIDKLLQRQAKARARFAEDFGHFASAKNRRHWSAMLIAVHEKD
jgi:CHAD domain-containing protein